MSFTLTPKFGAYGRKLSALFLTLGLASGLWSQSCFYTVEMFDSFGDGWNGGMLTVNSDGVETMFTLQFGDFGTGMFEVTDGAPLIFNFSQGFFPTETSFNIIDPEGMIVFSAVGPIDNGEIFNDFGACPSCLSPFDAFMSDVNADNADVSWTAPDGYSGNYILEYDTVGFDIGTGQMVSVPYPMDEVTLTGLQENTTYELYIFLDCGPDSSNLVGPIVFHTLWLNDVGVTNITSPTDESCTLGPDEIVTIEMTNFGQLPQTLFDFFFSVNGQVASIPMPQDGFFTGVIGNDSTQSISFETTWDFSAADFYVIEAWTQLEGDSMPANDTFRLEIATAFQKPIMEDFEDGALPIDWTAIGGFTAPPDAHGNETWVWGSNLWTFNPTSSMTSTTVGPVAVGDSLTFDYRFVNFAFPNEAAIIGPGDMLELQISEDCGETFETVLVIDESNHDPTEDLTTQFVLLDDYDGKAIVFRFVGTWGNGDYWLDLDNINVTGCPVTFGIVPDIVGTDFGVTNGQISVAPTFGTAPYTYEWDNGGDTETITDLGTGIYTVIVTDANGCVDTETYELGFVVDVEEVAGVDQMLIYPNPTSGLATLDVSLTEAMDFEVRVFNTSGQIIYNGQQSMVAQVREELDFSNQPAGMYVLQVIANGQPHYAKIMVSR